MTLETWHLGLKCKPLVPDLMPRNADAPQRVFNGAHHRQWAADKNLTLADVGNMSTDRRFIDPS